MVPAEEGITPEYQPVALVLQREELTTLVAISVPAAPEKRTHAGEAPNGAGLSQVDEPTPE